VHVLHELLARELVMLGVLTGLGAGPASWLSPRFGAVERVALAPILGLCLGISLFTTLLYFFPAHDTGWLIGVVVGISVLAAAIRCRGTVGWRMLGANLAGWVSLAAVLALVTVPIFSVMGGRDSVGPVSYAVGDAIGYVAETDTDVHMSLHEQFNARPPLPDESANYGTVYAQSYQNLDVAPLAANVDSLLGLGSTDTWDAFLIAVVVAGGLGALAAVRWTLRESAELARTVCGATAGGMFAGAFFLQLYAADSEAALCGLAVLLPLAAVAADATIEPDWSALALLALLLAGLMAVYPTFVAPVAAAGGLALVFLAARQRRVARLGERMGLRQGAIRVGFVIALAALLNVVSFTRDLRYWKELLTGGLNSASLSFPVFNMKAETVPAWLFQARNLFTTVSFGQASLIVTLEEVLVPVLLIGIAIVALRRFPVLWWLVVVILVVALLGEYEAARYACSYCTDRSLLPIAPIFLGLVAVGLGVMLMSKRPLTRVLGVIVVVLWLVPAFTSERDMRNRVSSGGVFLESHDRTVLGLLPAHATVDVEGFDTNPYTASPAEPFAYELADERSNGHATIPGDVSDNNAIAYFGVRPLDAGQFNPFYQYVLTRLPGIETDRQVVGRLYGVALEKRVQPLDVTPDDGLVAPEERADPDGEAWLSNTVPLRLIVAGPGSVPAYVGLRIVESVPTQVTPNQPGVRWRLRGNQLFVCVRATGTAPARIAQFGVTFNPEPSSIAIGPYALPPVGIGVQLAEMRVAAGRCPFAAEVR
jgi:hypothetical protein